jgi:6-aminohexanoate-oligomer endohydrolase
VDIAGAAGKTCKMRILITLVIVVALHAGHAQTSGTQRMHNHPGLKPDTSPGDHVLRFDFPGLEIGTAVYREGPTGCTVFNFPEGAIVSADIRGGAPATICTDQLLDSAGATSAICLAGGSVYGLEAVTGVMSELFARQNYGTDWRQIRAATGAIIFDFRPRDNAIVPDVELGRAALRAAKPGAFPMGAQGAGVAATCGKLLLPKYDYELCGQGGAMYRLGEVRVAVFTVVNAVGAIVDRSGKVVRGFRDAATGERVRVPDLRETSGTATTPRGNTTLTVLVTNVKFARPDKELRQLARSVHASMNRAIQPFHMPTDGDVFFAATTNDLDDPSVKLTDLVQIGSECAWDAVLSSFTGREP